MSMKSVPEQAAGAQSSPWRSGLSVVRRTNRVALPLSRPPLAPVSWPMFASPNWAAVGHLT